MNIDTYKAIVKQVWPNAIFWQRAGGGCIANPGEFAIAIGKDELEAWKNAAEAARAVNKRVSAAPN